MPAAPPPRPADLRGPILPLTTLSPVVRGHRGRLMLRLAFVRRFPGLSRPVLLLRFIHYGRWLVLDDVPAPDGSGRPVPLNTSYLMFDVAYDAGPGAGLPSDGAEAQDYLDAFADTLPARLVALWGNCVNFGWMVQRAAGARQQIAPWAFRGYVRDNALHHLHFHAAYQDSVATVRQAIAMAAEHPDGTGVALAKASGDLVRLAPEALGPVPRARSFRTRAGVLLDDALRANAGRYGVSPMTVVAPVAAGVPRKELERRFKAFAGASPLADEPLTHFARFCLLEPTLMDLGQPDPDDLGAHYLLFTSSHSGSARRYVESLRTALGEQADHLWGACAAYPGHGDRARFHDWFERHSRPTSYFVPGYPPRTVEEIRAAVARRAQVAERLRRESWGDA